MEEEHDQRAKKKTKHANTALLPDTVHDLIVQITPSIQPDDPNIVGEASTPPLQLIPPAPLNQDFIGQNFPINPVDVEGLPPTIMPEEILISVTAKRSLLETDPPMVVNASDPVVLNLYAANEVNITILGPPSALSSLAGPFPMGLG